MEAVHSTLTKCLPNEAWLGGHSFSTVVLTFSFDPKMNRKKVLTEIDLQDMCILPAGAYERFLCKLLSRSQLAPQNEVTMFELQKEAAVMVLGNIKFRLIRRSKHKCMQVDIVADVVAPVLRQLKLIWREIKAETGMHIQMHPCIWMNSDEHRVSSPQLLRISAVGDTDSVEDECRYLVTQFPNLFPAEQSAQLLTCLQSWHGKVVPSPCDQYDVFISYRWNSRDTSRVDTMFESLSLYTFRGRPLSVFLDRETMHNADHIREMFVGALRNVGVVVPMVTPEALKRMKAHNKEMVDNVLVEWITIQFLRVMKVPVGGVFPLLFNDDNCSCFAIAENLPPTHPKRTVAEVRDLLVGLGYGDKVREHEAWLAKITVQSAVTGLFQFLLNQFMQSTDWQHENRLIALAAYNVFQAVREKKKRNTTSR
jgi:hypothetical protein